ncbi:MAG: glycosyltransferase family 2 protein [Sphingomonas sp.]|uniref:glycosyltransferase family 2 protein n=1 Tax=Sphingomonas sp. TaxID=28214 RepID=UPI001AD429FD|nr:glycosyltransferase family 2 protein [Sphingomonas sp.]MBN8816728.1 glycosyltransferase family 2 protein [Sphingomonas sp.]
MSNPSISFVIPTFNFAAFLPETLDSIVNERYSPIEIIVFDGGSTDDTLAVLEAYRTKFPALKVMVATERGNIDTDLNLAVDAAQGDFIWTMSADDTLMPGWSEIVAELLAGSTPDLLLVPAIHCDIRMQPRRSYPIMRDPATGVMTRTLVDDDSVIDYLSNVRTSEGLFSFCSACIVRREKFRKAPALVAANGTCWRYSVRLISVLVDYPSTIVVLDRPLIYKRGDNDSFAQAGVIRRLRIATLGWDDAIGALDLRPGLRSAMLSRVKSDIRPFTLLYMSQFVRDDEERATYRACVDTRMKAADGSIPATARILKRLPRFLILRKGLEVAKAAVRIVQQRIWSAQLPVVD